MVHIPSMAAALVPPRHVAIVMDGNGRWAQRRFLPRLAGHRQGVESLRRCVQACAQRGIGVLTVCSRFRPRTGTARRTRCQA